MLYSAPLPPELKLKKVSPEPLDELAEYLHPFAHHFKRSEGRQSLERHMSGLLADIDCKNGEQIATAVAGTNSQRLQALLTERGCPNRARPRWAWLANTRARWGRWATVKWWCRVSRPMRASRGQSMRASTCTRAGPRRRLGVSGRRSRKSIGRLPPSPRLP